MKKWLIGGAVLYLYFKFAVKSLAPDPQFQPDGSVSLGSGNSLTGIIVTQVDNQI
jgi:hypothetical protein